MQNINRDKLCSLFDGNEKGLIYLQGASVQDRYHTDFEYPFRQESNFLYLTGVEEPDFHCLISPVNGEYYLFTPKRDALYAVWYGYIRSQKDYKSTFKPDHILFDVELGDTLKKLKPSVVYCLNNNQASAIQKLGFKTNTETLPDALAFCRTIKSDDEIELMRHAADITCGAHRAVLESLKPGMMEYELKAVFDQYCISHGLLHEAYTGIYGSGRSSAILHYVANNRKIEENSLFLIDAGYEYKGYAHDVTRTYPSNGKFSKPQAQIYDAVLDAHNNCIKSAKPGIQMEDLHMQAARIMMEHLIDMKLIQGDIEEVIERNIFALFFPHGLGHFLGLDTHDVGGYPRGVEHIDRPGIKFLRVRRILEPGMVVTIEPGLYIIPSLLNNALKDPEQSRFLNKKMLLTMMDFGGIRIEDNIVIREGAPEDLTDTPKERSEIEKIMAK